MVFSPAVMGQREPPVTPVPTLPVRAGGSAVRGANRVDARTAPYQTDASASTRTSPPRVAVGAIHACGLTCGARPSKLNSGTCPSCPKGPYGAGGGGRSSTDRSAKIAAGGGTSAGRTDRGRVDGAPGHAGGGQRGQGSGKHRHAVAGDPDPAADALGHGRQQGGADRGTNLAAGVDHAADQALIGV